MHGHLNVKSIVKFPSVLIIHRNFNMAPKKKGCMDVLMTCTEQSSVLNCTVLYKVLVLQRPVSTSPVCGSENVEDHIFT